MNSLVKHATLAACIATITTVGCSRNHPRPLDLQTGQLSSSDSSNSSRGQSVGESGIEFANANEGVKTVYFDYDSDALRADALATLKGNSTIFSHDAHWNAIRVEGHCDERGTQEYNLALGEQRALAVRHHLINLGIQGTRISTISYGEERPADPGHSENAYALNRRCEFAVHAN